MKQGLCSVVLEEAQRLSDAFRLLEGYLCPPVVNLLTLPANHLSIAVSGYKLSMEEPSPPTVPSENSQIMKLLFHTGNNLRYDFCIPVIEAMFEKAMFLGGLVTISTETSFNAIFQWCVFLSIYAQYLSMNEFTCSEHSICVCTVGQ